MVALAVVKKHLHKINAGETARTSGLITDCGKKRHDPATLRAGHFFCEPAVTLIIRIFLNEKRLSANLVLWEAKVGLFLSHFPFICLPFIQRLYHFLIGFGKRGQFDECFRKETWITAVREIRACPSPPHGK